jgi:hypothetical protein
MLDGLKLNGAYQLLVYADDVNIWGRTVHIVRKNTDALQFASKEIRLQANSDRTEYMFMS